MDEAVDQKPCPYCGERIRAEAIKCRWCGERLDDQGPSGPPGAGPAPSASPERVLYEGSGSQWINIKAFMIGGAALAGALVLLAIGIFENKPWMVWPGLAVLAGAGAYLIRAFIGVRFVRYQITTHRIQVERGWLSRHLDQIDFVRVRDVDLHQGPLDRMFGIGNITVYSKDPTTPTFTLRGLAMPRDVYDVIQREALTTIRRRGYVEV
jgi:membrane protein YdbS with pleckstrin-like domain